MPQSQTLTYDERLTAPRTWWLLAGLFGLSITLVFLPYGVAAALVAMAVGSFLGGSFVSKQGATRIRVVGDFLVVDDARIPLDVLGQPQVLEGDKARAWRTYKADMRAFMVMRSYISTAVRVENIDPDDPTPYVYLSTRAPQRLARAISRTP